MQNNKHTVIAALQTLITDPLHDEGKIAVFFAPDYQQNVDGMWICPYISRHLLSLNPLLARCRRYSRGER